MQWFLPTAERGNPDTVIDRANGVGYTRGNLARPLIHGRTYFAELLTCINAAGAGDLIWFTDWQSNGDQRLDDDPGSELLTVLKGAVGRGADVRALVWRSHSPLLGYSADEHRDLGEDLQALGADVLLDMRVRQNGAHHQKFVVIRYGYAPEHDVAFVGGIDLCHGRRDDACHAGDPQADEIAAEYGPRPPWHDVQVAIHGPAVHDVETVFRERWEDSCPTTGIRSAAYAMRCPSSTTSANRCRRRHRRPRPPTAARTPCNCCAPTRGWGRAGSTISRATASGRWPRVHPCHRVGETVDLP
jgi:phosphatidylserine/phosphatidylglycerophosphate/cardiolipin synthase-like enzyme